jgi:GcrA cell cycle regulator
MSDTTWSDERVELLKKLWTDGLSASQIAAEMGGVTRNAVIGKVHRLGLSGRAKSTTSTVARQPVRKPSSPHRLSSRPTQHRGASGGGTQGNAALKMDASPQASPDAAPQAAPVENVVVPMSERVTIMELRESMCRWPMGDPTTPDFRYCGAKSDGSSPYCTYHCKIAYQPSSERRRERKMVAS